MTSFRFLLSLLTFWEMLLELTALKCYWNWYSNVFRTRKQEREITNDQWKILKQRGNFKITLWTTSDKFHWAMWLTGEYPFQSVISKQLYWNRALAWVFSCKSTSYFQNKFFLRSPLEGCFWYFIKMH